MHEANAVLWRDYILKRYATWFGPESTIVELGSHEQNMGTIRQWVGTVAEYVGVDWRKGPCVDVVSLVHELDWEQRFSTVISSSMLEHDPFWKKSLSRAVKMLRPGGAMFLSWGAAHSRPHKFHFAPDGGFHALPVKPLLDRLENLGMYIHDVRYESSLPEIVPGAAPGGIDSAFVAAFVSQSDAPGERHLDTLVPEDMP